jgi:CRP-like cAMP-binding protein
MYIIQNGMIEIYTTMDNGVDFVLERLYRGSVINHRSFLLNDNIDIFARCATPVSVYYITLEKFNVIRSTTAELDE